MYYLSGIDWVIQALDRVSRSITGCGMNSQVVLRLNGRLDSHGLRRAVTACMRGMPWIAGHLARALNGAPYWAYPAGREPSVSVLTHECADDTAAAALFEREVNRPFSRGGAGLRFVYATAGERSFLSLVFDHRLLDARGAQELLFQVDRYWQGNEKHGELSPPARASGLSRWGEKFAAGQRVNRFFRAHSGAGDVRRIPLSGDAQAPFLFRSRTLDADETRRVRERAYATAGYLMIAPYLLAAALVAFRESFSSRLSCGTRFVVPVNTDQRRQQGRAGDIFFNQLSFLFLSAEDAGIGLDPDWIAGLSRRMYEAVSCGFARDLEQACLLLRIVPLPVLDRVMRLLMRGEGISFAFSYVHTGYPSREFCGVGVG
ncbi:MAG: hypothetical protein MJA29_03610, partial [Candidatus Omnitrophica bacterium]|nr:hypothetical protein [Candidatus Omnitrophota bacterium]